MSEAKLKPLDVSLLNDCRLIAAENYTFYNRMYDRIITHFDKEVIGRVMAQKKECIDAIERLLSAQVVEPSTSVPETQKLVLSLPADEKNETDPSKVVDIVENHESLFEDALTLTLEQLEDETTMEVLRHHRDAAFIAKQAMFETA